MRNRQAYDRHRYREQPWRAWYNTPRWRGMRARHLHANPLCVMCLSLGMSRRGRNVDHVIPHRGDANLFWNGKLQTLCDEHHNATKQAEELRGYSLALNDEGWPEDPAHPFNHKRGRRPHRSVQGRDHAKGRVNESNLPPFCKPESSAPPPPSAATLLNFWYPLPSSLATY